MKPFKLEAVLGHRKRSENSAQKELLASLDTKEEIIRIKAQEEVEMARLYQELGEAKTNEVSVSDLLLYESCICCKKREVRKLDQQLLEMDATIKRKRQKLVLARQEKRALEIVKESRQKQEKQKQKHLEDLFFDEVAVLCFGSGK